MAFLTKNPSVAASQVGGMEQASTIREAEAKPIGYGLHPYASHWLTQQFAWRKVKAGNQGDWNYYSIAASYGVGPFCHVAQAVIDGKEIYDINYDFEEGEDSHTFTLNGSLAGGYAMTVTVFRGSETQNFGAVLGETGQDHPPYKGQGCALWTNLVAGINQTAARQCVLVLGRATPAIGPWTPPPFSPRYGVNLIAAIYWFCVGRMGALAAKTARLNPAHWGAQAALLESVGIGQRSGDQTYGHPVFTSSQEGGSAISEILSYFDGFVYDQDGELRIGWFPHDAPPTEGVPEIAEQDLDGKPGGDGFGDLSAGPTSVLVVFKDKDRRYADAPARFNAPVNRRNAKAGKPVRKERPFIHAVEQARVIAAEASADLPGDSGVTLPVFKSRAVDGGGAPLMPGALVNWDYAPHQLDLNCRVIERRMRFGSPSDLLKVIRERGAFPKPYVPAADDRVPQTDDDPGYVDSADVRLWLLPSGFYSDNHVAVLINRSKLSIVQAVVSMSTAGAAPWSDVLTQSFFAAKCTITSAGINSSVTTVRINSTSVDFDRFSAQDAVAQANDELLLVFGDEVTSVGTIAAVSSHVYDLGILRGRRGSTAAAHSLSAVGWLVKRSELVAVEHEELQHISSGGAYSGTVATKYFKIALSTPDMAGPAKPDDPGLSITMPDTTPGAITGLTATAGTGRAVTLVWPAIAGATEYKTYRNTSNSPSTATALDAEVSSPTYTDMGMVPGTYWYWVAPVSGGELIGPKSNGASVTVVDVVEGGIDDTAPADPEAATFNSYGWYAAADTTIYSWIKINLPASFPTLAKIVNVLYRKVGSTGWIVADQRTAGGGSVRIDDLSPGTSYDIALQAFSAYAIPSGVVAATGSPFSAPMKTDLPAAGTSFAWVDGDSATQPRPPPVLRNGTLLYAAGVTFVESDDPHLAFYEIGTTTTSTDYPSGPDEYGSEFPCLKGQLRFDIYKTDTSACYVWQRAVNEWGARGTYVLIGNAATHLKKPTGDLIERNGSSVGALAGVTSLAMSSARRFKKNIRPLKGPAALAELEQWKPKIFDWRTKDMVDDVGFLANLVAKFRPDAVHRDERGRVDSLDYTKAIPLLVAAVMHQQRQIEVLASEVARLRKPTAKPRKLKRVN